MGVIGIIALLIVLGIVIYAGLVTSGFDNFRGITLQLDDVYNNPKKMACAVFEELQKRGKECEIIEMDEGYPKFLIEEKKYVMVPKICSFKGIPYQVVHLKLCKD